MSARDVPACENVPGKVLKKPPSGRSVMLGRRGRALLLALLTVSSMVSLLDRAGAQGAGLKVSSDLELLGVGGLGGGRPRPVCCRGTDVRYVRIDRSDILEEGFPVERSVDGLVGVDPNSTERLEMRFIFNAGTVSEHLRFRFSDVPLADALHGIFEMRHSQSPTATDPWPFRLEGGWHSVPMADGLQALWHGDDSTVSGDTLLGQSDNGTANATRTTTSAIAPYTDLRVRSSANAAAR